MSTYLIAYGTDPTDRLVAYTFATRAEALRAATSDVIPRVPIDGTGGGCAVVINREADVTFSKSLLVKICAGLSGTALKGFATRAAGITRLFSLLPIHAKKFDKDPLIFLSVPAVDNSSPEQHRGIKMAKSKNETKKRGFKALKLGAFTPVRAGTKLAQVLDDLDGTQTIDDLVDKHGSSKIAMNNILRHSLAVMHGIGHSIVDGKVSLVLPQGKQHSDLIKTRAEHKPATTGERVQSKTKEAQAAAERGIAPPHLVITSSTNMHRQKKVDLLEKFANEENWDAVRAFHMNGVDTYSKMINRHRDLLLTAHNARQQ